MTDLRDNRDPQKLGEALLEAKAELLARGVVVTLRTLADQLDRMSRANAEIEAELRG